MDSLARAAWLARLSVMGKEIKPLLSERYGCVGLVWIFEAAGKSWEEGRGCLHWVKKVGHVVFRCNEECTCSLITTHDFGLGTSNHGSSSTNRPSKRALFSWRSGRELSSCPSMTNAQYPRSLSSRPDDCFGPVSEHRVRHATNHKMHSGDWSVYLGVRPRCY